MKTAREFVAELFSVHPVTPEKMTVEDARCDLRNFRADGWAIPEELTPELYAALWNEFCD